MYADDTTLVCDLNSIPEANMYIVLNNELEDIRCRLASNKLLLSVSKTKYTIFHTNQVARPDLKINNIIERMANFKLFRIIN